jgi:O-antigen ligase
MQFTANIGTIDRLARLVAGVVLIVLTLTGTVGVWGWIGVVPLATAFMRVCPIYSLLGIRTCRQC